MQLFVEGTIAEQAGFSSSFSSKSFIKQLDQAQKDPDVKAVVIRVNSPGGEVVASDEIHNKIEEVKKSGKLIAVSMALWLLPEDIISRRVQTLFTPIRRR